MPQPFPIPVLSETWLLCNGLGAAACLLFLRASGSLSERGQERLARGFGWALLARHVLIQLHFVQLDVWSVQTTLPLHFSPVTSLIAALAVLTRRQLLYEIALLFGVLTGIQTLATPLLPYGDGGLMLPDYFVHHWAMLTLPVYMTLRLGFRPRRAAGLVVWAVAQPMLMVVGVIDLWLDANYMFLRAPPPVKNPLVQGDYPQHLILFEVAGFIQFNLLTALTRWLTRGRGAP